MPRIELGTAVVPTYPRHPMVLAGQALTASAASGGRLTLGIGLSHQLVIEGMWGYSFDKPVRHMREYLARPGARCARARACRSRARPSPPTAGSGSTGASPVPVLVAALGPAMLKLAAERTAGTITWMTGPKTLADHTVPTLLKAAEPRPAPARCGWSRRCPSPSPSDVDGARERAARVFSVYNQLPSYRAMLDREGAEGPADVALIGSEAEVRAGVERLRSAGVTDFVASEFSADPDVIADTRDLLKSLL